VVSLSVMSNFITNVFRCKNQITVVFIKISQNLSGNIHGLLPGKVDKFKE